MSYAIHCPKVQDRYERVLFNYEYNNLFNIIVLVLAATNGI